MPIKIAAALYNKLIKQYGMKEGWFDEGWHIKNARLNVGGYDFEILRFRMRESESDEPICVFTNFVPLKTTKCFTGWTNTAEVVCSEDEANKAIEFFKGQEGSGEFELDKGSGEEIIAAYTEDDDFLGLAINAPENGFVVFAETVHDCCDE